MSSDTTRWRGNLMGLPNFCTSTELIQWQPTVSLVTDPTKMSKTPNTSYVPVCSSLLNTAPHPFTQTPKCICQLTRWWKSLTEGLKYLQEQIPMSSESDHSHFQASSLPSDCPNNSLTLKIRGKWKARKPLYIWLVGFESCHFCKQTS